MITRTNFIKSAFSAIFAAPLAVLAGKTSTSEVARKTYHIKCPGEWQRLNRPFPPLKPEGDMVYGGGKRAQISEPPYLHRMHEDPNQIPFLYSGNYESEGRPRVVLDGEDVTDFSQFAVPGETGWVQGFEPHPKHPYLQIGKKRVACPNITPMVEGPTGTFKRRIVRTFREGHVEFIRPCP